MKAKTTFKMKRANGYGQYLIVKETPSGKVTTVGTTDSQLFDDFTDGKPVQSRLKMVFNSKIGK